VAHLLSDVEVDARGAIPARYIHYARSFVDGSGVTEQAQIEIPFDSDTACR
jgi:hypothetical protein